MTWPQKIPVSLVQYWAVFDVCCGMLSTMILHCGPSLIGGRRYNNTSVLLLLEIELTEGESETAACVQHIY